MLRHPSPRIDRQLRRREYPLRAPRHPGVRVLPRNRVWQVDARQLGRLVGRRQDINPFQVYLQEAGEILVNSPTQSPGPPPPKLLDRVTAKMRLLHHSKRTEGAYVDGIKRSILFHHQRHPRDMGDVEVESFITDLAFIGNVAASTQNQAFSAILFLDHKLLEIELPKLNALRARRPESLPVVLAVEEVRAFGGITAPPMRSMSSARSVECRRKAWDIEAQGKTAEQSPPWVFERINPLFSLKG